MSEEANGVRYSADHLVEDVSLCFLMNGNVVFLYEPRNLSSRKRFTPSFTFADTRTTTFLNVFGRMLGLENEGDHTNPGVSVTSLPSNLVFYTEKGTFAILVEEGIHPIPSEPHKTLKAPKHLVILHPEAADRDAQHPDQAGHPVVNYKVSIGELKENSLGISFSHLAPLPFSEGLEMRVSKVMSNPNSITECVAQVNGLSISDIYIKHVKSSFNRSVSTTFGEFLQSGNELDLATAPRGEGEDSVTPVSELLEGNEALSVDYKGAMINTIKHFLYR